MNMRTLEMLSNTDDSCADSGVLAMAFINRQPLNEVYELSAGFESGTIFPDLDKPFLAGGMKQ